MKTSLKLLLAGTLALFALSAAEAQTVIRITGSTAYRGATHTGITHILAPGFTFGFTGGTLSGASQAIFTGTVGGNSVIIKTAWSGSVGGVQTVSQGLNVNFLPNSTAQSVGGTSGATTGAEAGVPDVAMSDTFQSSTVFTSPALNDQIVGVVPFRWVINNGGAVNLNMTPQLAQYLWGNGSAPLALWTGLHADQGTIIFATGRDPDSGTRLTAFAESGIGVNSVVQQYKPTISGGVVTGNQLYPQQTVNSIVFPLGQGGEASGGTLAVNMTATGSNAGSVPAAQRGFYMTYLSTGDAATAITGGAKEMLYNGTLLEATAPFTSVFEGRYTFWGYEHLMYKSTLTGTKKTVADTLANQILTVDGTVLVGSMQVGRSTDGGLITANYF